MDLRVKVQPPHQVLTLTIGGELDAASAGELIEVAAVFQATRFPQVVLDVAGLQFCDGAGLAALLTVQQQVTDAGGQLRLHRPSPQLRRLLQLTGCLDLLPAEPTKPALRLIRGAASADRAAFTNPPPA